MLRLYPFRRQWLLRKSQPNPTTPTSPIQSRLLCSPQILACLIAIKERIRDPSRQPLWAPPNSLTCPAAALTATSTLRVEERDSCSACPPTPRITQARDLTKSKKSKSVRPFSRFPPHSNKSLSRPSLLSKKSGKKKTKRPKKKK